MNEQHQQQRRTRCQLRCHLYHFDVCAFCCSVVRLSLQNWRTNQENRCTMYININTGDGRVTLFSPDPWPSVRNGARCVRAHFG